MRMARTSANTKNAKNAMARDRARAKRMHIGTRLYRAVTQADARLPDFEEPSDKDDSNKTYQILGKPVTKR
jgi:hypothetical protein